MDIPESLSRLPRRFPATVVVFLLTFIVAVPVGAALNPGEPERGSVIFIHPDGAAVTHWTALRLVDRGPDGLTAWDQLDRMGLYRGHPTDSITSSSHAGATTHAFGKKVLRDSYGMNGTEPLTALSGAPHSIAIEAHKAGIPTGIVNSGHIAEPGTGVFAASHTSRGDRTIIAAKILESGLPLIFSGGERYLLPAGEQGFHGAVGVREDGRNLVAEAEAAGYTVVYHRKQLEALDPAQPEKVLGVFAAEHTFFAEPEEVLAAAGLPLYIDTAPTFGEMTAFAIEFLAAKGRPFFLVAEEEGADNFPNNGNASGMLEALRRSDAAIRSAVDYIAEQPDTLLVVAADSNAANPALTSIRNDRADQPLPTHDRTGAPIDGRNGPGSLPFQTAPDARGNRLPFAIVWPGYGDVHGGVIARAHGLNSGLLPMHVQNTDIYRLMYATLFGKVLD
ncbi:MAG: alkaline phosphatase [Opitutales bacterium]